MSWQSFSHSDDNGMIRFKKKLQDLKVIIRRWIKVKRLEMSGSKNDIVTELGAIDKDMDRGVVNDDNVLRRLELKRILLNVTEMEAKDRYQKSKFHKKLLQSQADDLERCVSCDEIQRAVWDCGNNKSPGPDGYTFEFFKKYWDFIGPDFCDAVEYFFVNGSFFKGCNSSFVALIPKVIDAKFVNDFRPISLIGCIYKVVTKILANRLVLIIADLVSDTQSAFVAGRQILDNPFILDEIYIGVKGRKNKQCNSSFVALIPKVIDAKSVNDFRPISLIGCIYKVVTKILANRLVLIIADLVSDTQSAFVAGRQILDSPFILDEILHWCKRKKKQAMFFKVDFAKAYDSVRWDYLLDVLKAFGFGHTWCKGTPPSQQSLSSGVDRTPSSHKSPRKTGPLD
nr:RNA-directed DNA polymerase, eukaryota [Tanacetum cinerariifolium]